MSLQEIDETQSVSLFSETEVRREFAALINCAFAVASGLVKIPSA
jgi:hypothetical protein